MRKILIVLFALISYTLNAQVYERTVTAKDTLKTKGAFVYQGANVPVPYGAYVMWSTSGTGSPITNPSQWHKTWVAGDKYLSFSSDYRLTWSRSILVGELSETDPVVRALSGIIKGTGVNITTATPNIDYLLPNAPITGATHTKITYDAKGLVVTGTDISTSDVPEGSRLYYTDARVSNNPTVLQALSAQHLHANKSALDVVSGYNSGDENRTSILTKLGAAYSGADGYLKKEDWVTFNGKQDALVGTGLVRSTNGVITYDTNNYLTSLSGAVLTNQVFGQVIGDNANRLHHLYADSLDVTTTIVGSITGHAGSATTSDLLDGYHYTHFADSLHKHSVLYQPNGSNGFVYTDNSGQLHIDGNIIQSGSSYTTHAEQIYTNDDYIILRANASAGLGTNEYAGFEAVKFDGVNNGRFVFDNTGLARVGTVGSERAIAVRIESPTDGYIATWDNANKRLDFIARTTFQAADADLAAIAAFTGTGLARRTGSGTWTLDTNSYLTSLTGALLLDQSTPQSVTGGAPIFDGVRLNTSGALTPVTGMFFWNATEKTASLQLADGGSYELGQEMGDYYKNVGATTMINGDIVSIASTPGNAMAIELTDATDVVSSRNCIGMVTVSSIAPNGTGRVTKIGKVRGLNTDSYTEGDIVYVNPAQPGKLTATRPTAHNHIVKVGSVAVKNNNNGVIDLSIHLTSDLAGLSDVLSTGLNTSGLIPVWDQTNNRFAFSANINNYEGAISKSTGFLKWTGSAWSWDNSTYALSSDLTSHANLTTTAHGLGASAFHADSFFAPASGSANYIQNQNSSAQTANMWISGGVAASNVYASVIGSDNVTVGNTNTQYSFTAYSGYWGFRNGTDYSFNIDTYNGGTSKNVLTITQPGAATFSSTIQATTAKLTNLSDGYIPYHISDASGLGNSNIYTNGAYVAIGGTGLIDKLTITGGGIAMTTSGSEYIYSNGGSGSSVNSGIYFDGVNKFLKLITNNTEYARMDNIGNWGFQLASPTAKVHIAAGTATSSTAPLKFTSGTLLTTPEAGAIEFLTDSWYGTRTTNAKRSKFLLEPLNDEWITTYDYAGNSANLIKLSKDNIVEFSATVGINSFYHVANSGLNDIVDIPVNSFSTSGTEHGVGISIGGQRLFKVSALSDGAGGVNNALLNFTGNISTNTGAATTGLYWDNTNLRLGIGTKTPTYILDINGGNGNGLRLTAGNASWASRITLSAGTNEWGINVDGSTTYFSINDLYSGGTPFSILRGGNVGIGTTSPTQGQLTVINSIAITTANNVASKLSLYNNTSYENARIECINDGSFNDSGYLKFYTAKTSSGGLTEKMEITPNGNLLVGTTTDLLTKVALPTGAIIGWVNSNSYTFGIRKITNSLEIVSTSGTDFSSPTTIVTTGSDGATTFSGAVTSTQFKLSALNTAPSSASDTGTLGEIRITADAIYICTATNTWKKATIATW